MSLARFLMVRLGRLASYRTRRRLRQFEAACQNPQAVQAALRERILAQQADTGFGTDHHFASIKSLEEFRRNIPIAPYEYVAPYIEKVQAGDTNALLARTRVLMFALTSGTTASRKLIPVTPQYLADYKRGWNMWGVKMYRDHRGRKIAMRPMVQMVGDPCEFRTEAGIACGNLSGYTAQVQMRLIRRLYAVPPESGRVHDALARYYVALRFSIGRNVSQFMAANPSTLMQLARTLNQNSDSLLKDLHDGTLSANLNLPPDLRALFASRLKPNPKRARELVAVASREGRLFPKDVWPAEGVIILTWTGGSMGPYLRQLPEFYGETPVRDLGLLASEGRMTLPFANSSPSGVLDISSHYFEFVPESEIDGANPTVLESHELREGENYYILPTTSYGLYRYHISDVVRCTGFFGRTPMIEFLGKGHRFANLTGEKLSEHHATKSVDAVLARVSLPVSTYSLAPVWDDVRPFYGFFLEAPEATAAVPQFLAELDAELGRRNIEYAAKREGNRLGPVQLRKLPAGFWATWDRERLAKNGGAAEQYKHPCLIGDLQFAAGNPGEP